ncbi:DEAD/DEAH box helicase [Luteolibacter pohnpeiensis]|uniref:DEAD/DEAH box helicase n=1 Tax=Luteolibacter pohnpeiensis TaxID=454153 RepID=A0A934SD93_9BACT|nr:DEAD/DEAH box helicase [Luteolibacter pohnpeiensis]MBK1884007.1 DEAD/DEAH box helicase [Luteolibacter pohnpeiensis]
MNTFKELGVSPDLIKGLNELGIVQPTEIQQRAIPFLIESGGDLIAQAQTGTGKTAAFGLPLLMTVKPEVKEIQAVIVSPTRDLAKQIGKQLFRFTKYSSRIFTEVLCGGDSFDRQVAALQRPTHIVVVTPGRLIDLLKKKALSLTHVKHLVLDEADEMLSMGFKKELLSIFNHTRSRKSTWLFSATIPDSINLLAKDCMIGKPQTIRVDKSRVVNRNISHKYVVCGKDDKLQCIIDFLKRQNGDRGVIFCRTKDTTAMVAKKLKATGFSIDVIHGDLMQTDRDKVMRSFKKERTQLLIATDIAARGIDVEGLAFVIHHQLPEQTEYYTHRSGRTARAGKKGISIAFIEARDRPKIEKLENELGLTFTETE